MIYKNKFDLSLYLVTDPNLTLGRELKYIVTEAIKGGVSCVQLREKDCTTKHFYNIAKELKLLLLKHNIPLIINDRLDIAIAVDADGLHVGQNDLPWNVVRKVMGKDKIIGLSAENIQQVEQANNYDVDYIGISPVFSTQTKLDIAKPFGLDGLNEARKISKHPLVAIGGINSSNVKEVIQAGADGAAVVSAISMHKEPTVAACELKRLIRNAKVKK